MGAQAPARQFIGPGGQVVQGGPVPGQQTIMTQGAPVGAQMVRPPGQQMWRHPQEVTLQQRGPQMAVQQEPQGMPQVGPQGPIQPGVVGETRPPPPPGPNGV